MVKYTIEKSNMKLRYRKRYVKAFQFISAFLCGVIISELYGKYKCDLKDSVEIDENKYLLISLILTAPNNFERREAIRDTWTSLRPWQINGSFYQNDLIFIPKSQSNGFLEKETVEQQQKILLNYQKWLPKSKVTNVKEQNLMIKTLFVIGMKELEDDLSKRIRAESRLYTDLLLLEDLKDSYKNLTLKLITALEKANKVTPNFNYLLKCDDDSFVKLDYLAMDLIQYDRKLKEKKQKSATLKNLELYWGFFNGRANIKNSGKWKETNYDLCDKYVPYALGGGYVISKNLVNYISSQADTLNRYESEDISLGTWLSTFRNIHRKHDPRFDTAYLPRKCRDYHLVLHKRTANDMRDIAKGKMCSSEITYADNSRPAEYFYDWSQTPSKCCDNKV